MMSQYFGAWLILQKLKPIAGPSLLSPRECSEIGVSGDILPKNWPGLSLCDRVTLNQACLFSSVIGTLSFYAFCTKWAQLNFLNFIKSGILAIPNLAFCLCFVQL